MDPDESFRQFTRLFPSLYVEEGYICSRLRAEDFPLNDSDSFVPISGTMFNILIMSGSVSLVVDNIRYECTPTFGNYIDCKPMNIVSGLRFSKDFDGFLVSICKEQMDDFSNGVKPMLQEFIALRSNATITLSNRQIRLLQGWITQIIKSNRSKGNFFTQQITLSLLKIYASESMNIIYSTRAVQNVSPANRRESLCNTFSELLLKNAKEHHEVTYYADQLCITSRYLSMVTRDILGRSASEMIADEVMMNAIMMLRTPSDLKDIADALHFSDQASFGKFFKKHSGQSPAAYRKSLGHSPLSASGLNTGI